MAAKTETSAAEAPSRVETEVAQPQVSSVTIGKDGPEATTHDEHSDSLELGGAGGAEEDEEQDGAGEGSDADEGQDEEQGSGSDEDALPDYDPESDEVRSQYDARYFKDGELNREAISAEFWKSFEANDGDLSKSGLPDGFYAYLKDTVGVSKAMAKEIEASLVAKHTQDESQFFGKFGGVDRYNRAITWAKDGGYSDEQQQRFRDAYSKGGADRDDAVDALMNRFHRANPPRRDDRRGPPQGRRSSSPQRDATGATSNRGPADGDRFKNAADHQAAWNAGLSEVRKAKDGGDKKAVKDAQDALSAISRKARKGYSQR